MKKSILLKSIIAFFFHFSKINHKKIQKKLKKNKLILMYHRILSAPDINDTIQPGMFVEAKTFRMHLKYLKSEFEIVPLSSFLLNNQKKNECKPECIITFDDGWHDFYQHAFPILKEFNAPATVFLPTEYIGSYKWFWTDHIARILKNNTIFKKNISKNIHAKYIKNLKGIFETRLENAINVLKLLHKDEIEQVIKDIFWDYEGDNENLFSKRAFMTWEEIDEIKKTGLIDFGSHTAGHQILTTLQNHEIKNELNKSKQDLISRNIVQSTFIPFCYPNGNYNNTIIDIMKESNYSLAVTTDYGLNEHDTNIFKLKRIGLHQDMSSTKAMLSSRIAGII